MKKKVAKYFRFYSILYCLVYTISIIIDKYKVHLGYNLLYINIFFFLIFLIYYIYDFKSNCLPVSAKVINTEKALLHDGDTYEVVTFEFDFDGENKTAEKEFMMLNNVFSYKKEDIVKLYVNKNNCDQTSLYFYPKLGLFEFINLFLGLCYILYKIGLIKSNGNITGEGYY